MTGPSSLSQSRTTPGQANARGQAAARSGGREQVDIVSAIGFYGPNRLTIIGFHIGPPPETRIHSPKIAETPGGQT